MLRLLRRQRLPFIAMAIVMIPLIVLGVSSFIEARRSLTLKLAVNSSKAILMALHSYHDEHGSFPPAVVRDDKGQPIHSWRASIEPYLPVIEERLLEPPHYDFSKPWDSAFNNSTHPNRNYSKCPFQFLAVVGRGAAWDAENPRTFNEFTDGSSQSVMLVALRNTGVKWHEPRDLTFDGQSLTLDGHPIDFGDGYFLLFADSSTHYFMEPPIPPAALTINAGDTLPKSWPY